MLDWYAALPRQYRPELPPWVAYLFLGMCAVGLIYILVRLGSR